MIKLIVSDLDGTLLTKHNKVAETDIHALKKALMNDIDICIATGRMDKDIIEVLKMVNGRFHRISQNGAFVFTKNDNNLHSTYFDQKIVGEIYHKSLNENTITLVSNENTSFVEKKDAEVKKIEKRLFFPLVENSRLQDDLGKIKPSKITIFAYDVEKRQQKIESDFQSYVDTFISEEYVLDIMPKNISKGNAVSVLIDHLGVSPEEIACIGDSFNDIPMFNLTPNSFVMSHANKDVQKYATYVVDSVSDAIEMMLR